jgi:hypothetical protein
MKTTVTATIRSLSYLFVVVCIFDMTTPAAPVDLSGWVVDEAAAPVAGAVVRTPDPAVADTTDADGAFRLVGELSPSAAGSGGYRGSSRGILGYDRAPAGGMALSVRSLAGRRLRTERVHGGEHLDRHVVMRLTEGMPAGLYVLVLSVHDARVRAPLVCMANGWSVQSRPGSIGFSKTHARAAVPDNHVQVSKEGYRSKTVAVGDWRGSLDTIVLVAENAFVPGTDTLDLTLDNRRRRQVENLPVFDRAGVGEGAGIPAVPAQPTLRASDYGVVAGDGEDDSEALQAAIDGLVGRAGASPDNPAVIQLPPGRILLTREIVVEADHVVIRGAGSDLHDPQSTMVVLRPGEAMRYDKIDHEAVPDIDAMSHNGNTMGWNWPGRGTFRVQTTAVSDRYEDDYAAAPANRKDIYEGSVNFHWTSGLEVDQDVAFPARTGDTVIPLDGGVSRSDLRAVEVGSYVWVGAANTGKMYEEQHVAPEYRERLHMKVQIFKVTNVDPSNKTLTIDKPLEFDIPANSAADGSTPIGGSKPYPSRVTPLRVVTGVGFESFVLSLEPAGLPALDGGTYDYTVDQARGNYGNMAPEYAMHGLVFKWAVDCWVRDVRTFMTGSHPVVTEQVRNIQVVHSHFDGSWNKGGGGNGYFRLSRAWDCLVHDCVLRNLRHLTLQWSSSGNVVIGNDLDCEINLHGGWERHNLIENNLVRIPYGHAHTTCTIGCEHIGGIGAGETWYPIYWATGPKAGKWSGSSGPRNIFFNNVMLKQETEGGPYAAYEPYYRPDGSSRGVIFLFGWDRQTAAGSRWVHLFKDGELLRDWAGNENVDYSQPPHRGVNATLRHDKASLFLKHCPYAVLPEE